MSRLLTLNPGRLDESVRLGALRAIGLAFARHGAPSPELRARVLAELEPRLPSGADAENLELVRLLVFLQSDEVVRRAMALIRGGGDEPLPTWGELAKRNDSYGGPIAKMLADMPPTRGIGYALALRRADAGWTPELRREYFGFFQRAAEPARATRLPRGHPRGRGAGPHDRGGAQLRGPPGHVAPGGAAGEHHPAEGAGPRLTRAEASAPWASASAAATTPPGRTSSTRLLLGVPPLTARARDRPGPDDGREQVPRR